jgi:hypothetical protein
MNWAHPGFLIALAVLIIPLLIHLFHFKRYKTLYFSSLTFLKSIEQEQQSIRKLKQWIIWSLRTLAFLCIVLAFAQPFLSNKKDQKTGVSVIGIYVDNSFSMSRIGQNGELISQARDLAKSVINDSPRNTQFVLLTNNLGGEEKRLLTKAQLLEKIEQLQLSPLPRSTSNVLKYWKQWNIESEKNQAIASSQLLFLSDFQKSTFGKLEKIADFPSKVYPIVLKPSNEGNLFIDSVWFENPSQRIGMKQIVYALVKNESKTNLKEIDINFQLGRINRSVYADLPAFGSDTVELTYYNQEPKRITCSVTVNDKQMNQDDSYYFSYDVVKNSKVLVINGEDAVSNIGLVLSLESYFIVNEKKASEVSTSTLKEYDAVILNGNNQVSSFLIKSLVEFSNEGGGILLFPGSNAAISGWNDLLERLEMPTISGQQQAGLTIKKINTSDSYFDGVFEKRVDNINLPNVKKAYRLNASKNDAAIGLLTYQNGSDFFIRSTGKRTVFFSSTSLNEEFSNFTSNQLFSTLVLRSAELCKKQLPYSLSVGESSYFPITKTGTSDAPIVLKNDKTSYFPVVFTKEENAYISIQGQEAIRSLKAGNYSIVSEDKAIGSLSVNYQRKESKTACYTTEEISDFLADASIPFDQVSDGMNWTGASFLKLEQDKPFWKWFLIFALLFLIAEMLVVAFFNSKQRTKK